MHCVRSVPGGTETGPNLTVYDPAGVGPLPPGSMIVPELPASPEVSPAALVGLELLHAMGMIKTKEHANRSFPIGHL